VRTAIAEDHGFATSSRAVDDSMAIAQRARQLLLLQVHDLDQAWQWRILLGE